METSKTYFLGVSSYLYEDAVGHYLGVHTDYHKELVRLSISHRYLGSVDGKGGLNWVDPAIGFVPTKLLNFDQIIKQVKLFFKIYKASSVGGKIFVFEGNFNYWLVLCLVTRFKKNSAHINLIRSDLIYDKLILGNNLIHKLFFYTCARLGKDNVSISTFSSKLSNRVNDLLPIKAGQIPTFSGFAPKLSGNLDLSISKNVLVFAPYLDDIHRLQQVLEEFPDLEQKITVSTWQSDTAVENLRRKNIKVFNSHLSDDDYEILLLDSSHVVLLYVNQFHKFGSSSKVYDCVAVNRNICVPNGTEVANQAFDCSNFYVFDGFSNEDIYNSIVSPKFTYNHNLTHVPNVAVALEYVLSRGVYIPQRYSLFWSILGVVVYSQFLIFSFLVTSAKAFRKLLRKILFK